MILNDDGTYDSMSEGEMEALEQVAMHRQVNNEDDDDQVFCDEDSSPALVVSKVLTLQHQQDEDQRCHIFHTKADINGRFVMVIIDGGSCHNLASEELCSKLQFVKMRHPHPYKIQWLSDPDTIHVEHRVQVSFNFHTKADINGRSVKVIIDGGSCHNLASEELCSKLQLVKMKHPHPYKVQ